MTTLEARFSGLGADNAPGQEVRQSVDQVAALQRGERMDGAPVDFSHGDVDAFPPPPGAEQAWREGYAVGGAQAYTEYRGAAAIREGLAGRLAEFSGAPIDPEQELILTPGTQGALFLAMGAVVADGTKVAIVEPDYFANRKLVRFYGGEIVPIPLRYSGKAGENGPDLDRLEQAFRDGTKVLVFSNPNNPTGHVCSEETINRIAALAAEHGATVIVDQLYSRLLYSGETYTHLRACQTRPENLLTIMGPSKTESLSGFRLGVAFGSAALVDRMEKLQAIVSLRAAGYNQAALTTWFQEPAGWMDQRIAAHEAIRDELLDIFRTAGLPTAAPQAGSYLFPELPPLCVAPEVFVRLLRHQAGVTVTPGSEFGPDSGQSIRLNFSQDHGNAAAAARRIVEMVERYRA
ncbi:pyridoxal phosphate-dependent aminotransferase [Tropicimonas sp. TH_r6]|uniref:pyridoxal phosphate-dependent aminotransferase n=1 Tax=Tropicimonas sp. TH_r6 TaxID=3082085 RepID=UPI002954CCE1|nr:pyridoxal phosphate-dependent aminotransferase [Tropicimonas sp. TH_r6]MDV7145231.1 pyridoxal phosphate-dependent aminotransferase [Tropicimonas sp. TH_r6]